MQPYMVINMHISRHIAGIGSDNDMAPIRRQAIILTNAGLSGYNIRIFFFGCQNFENLSLICVMFQDNGWDLAKYHGTSSVNLSDEVPGRLHTYKAY